MNKAKSTMEKLLGAKNYLETTAGVLEGATNHRVDCEGGER